MIIPVAVQRPCEPKSRTFVGHASEDLTPVQVAREVGVPFDERGSDCFMEGKIMKHRKGPLKGQRYWSLVADVVFSVKGESVGVCPHCGGEL